ncbi:MAG TPA: Crp/Fnr family transcriptional regulator [Cytophagaceae bacterium]|nr:Crp/Fnr family transcriptional regulator [Cytophagaceae bacterium]
MKVLDKFLFEKFTFNSNSIFNELPESELDFLNANVKTRLYKKRQVIFYEESYPIGVYYNKQGFVKKYKTGKDGKEQVFYISKTGDLLGYHALLSNECYFDSAAVMEDSIISFIPKDIFLATVEKSEILSKLLLKNISHEFGVLINNLTIISQMSVRERLALNLLILKDKFKDANGTYDKKTEIKISRDDLASMVGTATENLVRLLSEFKESGIIETNGKVILINNVNELVKISRF